MPTELKALYALGPGVRLMTPEILTLYSRKDCLVIGDGESTVGIKEIEQALKDRDLFIGSNTRIDVNAHGLRGNKEHSIKLDLDKPGSIKTRDFFKGLKKLCPHNRLYVHLWSCYGGSANKDVIHLGDGSILVTHVKSRYSAWGGTQDYSAFESLKRYFGTLSSPYLQYAYDQLENYEATTFNQVKKSEIKQFKSIRNPAENSVAHKLCVLPENQNLQEELKKYLHDEVKRFQQEFRAHLTIEDIQKVSTHIDALTNRGARNFVAATLMNLCHIAHEEDTDITSDIVYITDQILDRLGADKKEILNSPL